MEKQYVLMHQGGWDEILIGAGPLLIIGGLIYIARKRRPPEGEDDWDDWDDDDEYSDGFEGRDENSRDARSGEL